MSQYQEILIQIDPDDPAAYSMQTTRIRLDHLATVLHDILSRIEKGELDPGQEEHPELDSTPVTGGSEDLLN
jgi:hypothetical protein